MGALILLMGPTGAGKSTQGDMLARDMGGVHLSSGTLLRQDPRVAATLNNGQLTPAAEVERVIGEAIDGVPEDRPLILDGFPRTMSNVEWIERELESHHRKVTKVLLLELDIETSLARLSARDRMDDAPDVIRKKYEIFAHTTQAVVDYYDRVGLLVRVDGRRSPEEVYSDVKAAVR